MGFIILTILLSAFAVLAVIDGFYLHIFKCQLFNHKESEFEHKTHTARAILFPLIVFTLFIMQNNNTCFYLGILFVLLDVLTLAIDAFVEKDSRTFMGGLPRWEYILHLFVNGFHFAVIAVFLVMKLSLTDSGIQIIPDLSSLKNYSLFYVVSINLLPGAILIAFVHIFTMLKSTQIYWNQLRYKIACC
jgi:hypothetical protein